MKRKLIKYDALERIEQNSLSTAQRELMQAEEVVAKALGVDQVEMHCFGNETVVYECSDGTYVHANYELDKNSVILNNIEQLVVDDESAQEKSKEVLGGLVEALLEEKKEKAEELFNEFLTGPAVKKLYAEEKVLRVVPIRKKGKITGYKKARWNVTPKHAESSNLTTARMKGKKTNARKLSASQKNLRKLRRERIKRTIGEWTNLVENVNQYISIREHGPVLRESVVNHDDKGNIVSLQIPNKQLRNEAKLLSFNWKTLNTDLIVKRSGAKKLAESQEFCKALAELKRHNALADANALEECLENIVNKWPNVIYLTQNELSETVRHALETLNVTNYDDQVCEFMAEGILRTAHNLYSDRVEKVIKLSGLPVTENAEDKYASFQVVANKFYAHLDETAQLEMQVFVDLYEAIRNVHELANEERNNTVKSEASSHLKELMPVIQMECEPDLAIAEAAAAWLWDLVESNVEPGDWDVSNTPHETINGDHPDMAKKAKKVGMPDEGDFETGAVSDGQSYKNGLADEMRNNSWGNLDGQQDNPYVPAPFGKYEIKGEKTIDADSDQLAHSAGPDTWPNLSNQYAPTAVTPKMKADDLVVDK